MAACMERMIEHQLRARGLTEPRLLEAMARVPRHRFVSPQDVERAYDDCALPLTSGQTISQPYIVAYMTQWLAPAPGQRVLEVGVGSGYQAAVLAELGVRVIGVERHPALAASARDRLAELGYLGRVEVVVGDGTLGWPAQATYDRIIVTAAAPYLPRALVEQIAAGGRIVIPIGPRESQHLYVCDRVGDQLRDVRLIPCRFVPLLGVDGWPSEAEA